MRLKLGQIIVLPTDLVASAYIPSGLHEMAQFRKAMLTAGGACGADPELGHVGVIQGPARLSDEREVRQQQNPPEQDISWDCANP